MRLLLSSADSPPRPRANASAPLRRDITLALLLKLALLTALYLAFFRGDQRPQIDAAAMAQHLAAPR